MSMTPDQRKAASERMKAMHAKKKAERDAPVAASHDNIPQEQTITDLQRQIEELKSMIVGNQTPQFGNFGGPQVAGGRLVGTHTKYTVDPKYYANPVARLMKEPRLAQFAFDVNYDLTWEVQSTSYETKDGVNTKEPRFQIELRHIVRDEDGIPTNERYIIRRASFHEDPQAAIVIAGENGIKVDESNERQFLDDMRYLRIRDWLLDAFYRPKGQATARKKETVFGNRIVEVVELSSQEPHGIPFGELRGKV